jgi:orotidine-5'-phosphate decarboxylase
MQELESSSMQSTTTNDSSPQSFRAQLERRWQQGNFVCVGLDPEYQRLPERIKQAGTIEEAFFAFNKAIVDATHEYMCAYKPNSAFYEAEGEAGMRALAQTVAYIKEAYAGIPVILDAKRADIGNTNFGYVRSAFDVIGADAVTVHPYLGQEALRPFLERADKGIIVLVKTSNAGSDEFQNLLVGGAHELLYAAVARRVAEQWNGRGNCAVVVGATYAEELRQVRAIVGDMPILIPGIGAQGGDIEATVRAGRDSRGQGMIINSARGIIYASSGDDFADAAAREARKLGEEIEHWRTYDHRE